MQRKLTPNAAKYTRFFLQILACSLFVQCQRRLETDANVESFERQVIERLMQQTDEMRRELSALRNDKLQDNKLSESLQEGNVNEDRVSRLANIVERIANFVLLSSGNQNQRSAVLRRLGDGIADETAIPTQLGIVADLLEKEEWYVDHIKPLPLTSVTMSDKGQSSASSIGN